MNIGILNEGPLHQALKAHYRAEGAREEVAVGGFVADVLHADGCIYEIQTSGFGSLRRKLESVLEQHRVVLVCPIAHVRYLVKLPEEEDQQAVRRRSPKRGAVAHVVDRLVSIPRLLEHPNFELEVVLTEEEEWRRRAPGRNRRRNGWQVVQRRLCRVIEQHRFTCSADLWSLLRAPLPESFTTADLALAMGEPRRLGQKLAYCLRAAGQIEILGKQGNALRYRRTGSTPPGC
ncbi:MAG: hypothetical protein ACNA7W_03740 [Pseudomonadales bacterium]